MPYTNIEILLFILAMFYMGTIQGTFSSFLHLMVVIAAGTLAFAVWEPLTLGLLIKFMPILAWSLGLLVPFALFLLILRITCDKLVPGNAKFPGIANLVLGGACGTISGILTAGIAVIGLGFLPFSPSLGGYQPYTVVAGGVVQPTDSKLWIPVNSIAANFYGGLSGGAFASRHPMVEYKPDLDLQMSLTRVRPDNVSIVASPEAVKVTGVYMADVANLTDASPAVAEALGSGFSVPGTRLVIVDTDWKMVQNTVDADRALRLPSSHVRLITRSEENGIELSPPAGFAKLQGEQRVFYPYDSDSQMAFHNADVTFGWVFLVPPGVEPLFPQIRMLRLDMPEPNTQAEEVLAVLGEPKAPEVESDDSPDDAESSTASSQPAGNVGDPTGIRAGSMVLDYPEITNRLPRTASKNSISGLKIGTDPDGNAVVQDGSDGLAKKPANNVGQRNKINAFEVFDHEAMVRIRITSDQNRSIFAAGMSSAAALNMIYLEDTDGNKWQISAYVWQKENNDMNIHYDTFSRISSAKQMPISQMRDNDQFYLYFNIPKPTTLVSYNIGDVTAQDFEPPLEVR